MSRIEDIKTELDTDPLGRGYAGMTDLVAADDLNALIRPGLVDIARILKFLLLENTFTTDGTDTQQRAIWTRLKDMDALAVTPVAPEANPWGSTLIGNVAELQQIKTTQLLDFFTLSAQGDLPVDVSDSNFQNYLTGAVNSGCMSDAQKDALIALADNQQSRGTEINVGNVGEGHVTQARALP